MPATTASPTLTIGLLVLCLGVAVALAYLNAWPASVCAIACYPLAMGYMGYPIRLRGKLPKIGDVDLAVEPPTEATEVAAPRSPRRATVGTSRPVRRHRPATVHSLQLRLPD